MCVLLVLSWMYLPYGFKFTLDDDGENDAKGKDEEVGHLDEEKATASATALPVVLSDGKTRVAATGKEGTHTKPPPVD